MSIALQLTDSGRYLLALALAGENLNFTKLAIGSGAEPDSGAALTELVNTQIEMAIESYTTAANSITLKASFDNSKITTGFNWTETGVYAEDEDGSDVLYAYCNEGSNYTYVAAETEGKVLSTSISLVVTVDDAENITVNLGDNGTYALKSELSEGLKGLVPADYIIAANDTPDRLKKQADYICNELDDNETYYAGITDAISAGIEALGSTGGKIILLPGTYKKAFTILISADNVTIEGFGDATQLMADDESSYGITISGSHNKLRNFSIEHSPTAHGHNGLIINGSYNIIEGITFIQTGNYPMIRLDAEASGNTISNCFIFDNLTTSDDVCVLENYANDYNMIISCYVIGINEGGQTQTYYSAYEDYPVQVGFNCKYTETEPL